MVQNILVIKHGAFGDVILSFHPLRAIRAFYPNAKITVLTSSAYRNLYEKCPDCDVVWVDNRPSLWAIGKLLKLRSKLRSVSFDWVFDLQTSDRSGLYYHFFFKGRGINWSGIAKGCSHPDMNLDREITHTFERQKSQLKDAGIAAYDRADLSWLAESCHEKPKGQKYVLLIPGGAAHRPQKRWPLASYLALAKALSAKGILPVFIGGKDEAPMSAEIAKADFTVLDLIGKTSFFEIADLACDAVFAVGNDTGPMHLIGGLDCPSLVLFSNDSNPNLCRPRGKTVEIMQVADLQDLDLNAVIDKVQVLARNPCQKSG